MSDITPEQEETKKTINEMAQLTIQSGRINPIQEKNLLYYPKVTFNGILGGEIEYDFTVKQDVNDVLKGSSNASVTYRMKIDEAADNSHLDRRCKTLEEFIRHLFWKEVQLTVLFNDKEVYRSANG